MYSKQFGDFRAVCNNEDGYCTFHLSNGDNESKLYYACYHCSRIRSNMKSTVRIPTLHQHITTGKYDIFGTHLEGCKLYTMNEVTAMSLDRQCRQEVRTQVSAQPQATFEKYQELALKQSKATGQDTTDPASLNIQFGSYEERRNQLHRHRRQGVLAVEDAFDLPEAFKVTKADTKER